MTFVTLFAFFLCIITFFACVGRTVQKRPTRYDKKEAGAKIQVAEYIDRLRCMAGTVRNNGLCAFVTSSFFGQVYLIGSTIEPVRRKFFVIVYSDGRVVLVVPHMEREHLKGIPGIDRVVEYSEDPAPRGKQWIDVLVAQFNIGDLIVCEEAYVTRAVELLGHSRVDGGPVLEIMAHPKRKNVKDAMRMPEMHGMIKSAKEIEIIRNACALADMGVAGVCKALHIGVPAVMLYKVGDAVKMAMTNLMGFDPMRSKTIVTAWLGPNADPHYVPELGLMVERNGPHIACAFVMAHGYMVECERTRFVGRPNDMQVHYFATMMRAREYAFDQLRSGITAGELDRRVRRFMVETLHMPQDEILHGVGHGIGLLTFHNLPYLADVDADEDIVLQPGMVITIEPGVYVTWEESANGSYRHSDVVLITNDGYEILTRAPTDLEGCIVSGFKPLTWVKSGLIKFFLGMWR